jgi:hypothetical protein
MKRARGATLVVGLILLALVTLLGLAGASTAHVEQQLAQNEQFRENAASAASAGIEVAITEILNSSSPVFVPSTFAAALRGGAERYETRLRFVGYELSLPQGAGGDLVGAHFDIQSTGYSTRRAADRQRVAVMLVMHSADATPLPCEPDAPGVRCHSVRELERLSWQREPVE